MFFFKGGLSTKNEYLAVCNNPWVLFDIVVKQNISNFAPFRVATIHWKWVQNGADEDVKQSVGANMALPMALLVISAYHPYGTIKWISEW